MRWPWQSAPVEHRSSYTDQIVSALTLAASGGGARPALATAALESAASLYAGALSACEIAGPSSVTRALDASWRAAVASSLIRTGQCVYRIGASPERGLALEPVSHWDVMGGPRVSSWSYRCELVGPTATTWRTLPAGSVLHLRWQVDPDRPWAGVSPLQHASDTGSLAAWLEKRLSEEASGPVGSFLPVAKFEPTDDADLADDQADDPLGQLRRDIGAAKGQTLLVESQMSLADSPASAPRRDYQVARFGAHPPRDLVELREAVTRDVGSACGVPRALLDSSASGQATRESWRQFVATSVSGLARRIEAQVFAQLGVEIEIDTAPLGGVDVLARAAAFRRLTEGGLTAAEARVAVRI